MADGWRKILEGTKDDVLLLWRTAKLRIAVGLAAQLPSTATILAVHHGGVNYCDGSG